MAFQINLASAYWLFALGILAGCAGSNSLGSKSAETRQTSLPYSADGSSLLSGHGSAPAHPYATTQTPVPWTTKVGNSVTEAAHAVGGTVSSALEIKSKVDPADDPASLASMPKNLDPAIYIQSALRSEQHGDIEASQRQYEKAVELDPKDIRTAIYYGRFLERQKEFAKAVRVYQHALAIEPHNAVALNDLGLCHARQGQLQQALPPLMQAVEVQPGNARYRNNLANVLIATRQIDAAMETLLQIHPPAIAHYNVGYLLYRQQRTDAAVEHLVRSLRLEPNFPSSSELLAVIHVQQQIATHAIPPDYATARNTATATSKLPVVH